MMTPKEILNLLMLLSLFASALAILFSAAFRYFKEEALLYLCVSFATIGAAFFLVVQVIKFVGGV